MQMIIELKPNVKQHCSFCSHVLCHLNAVIIDEEILELLKFVNNSIDPYVLRDLLICRSCLEQIHNAKNFKISIQNSSGIIVNVKIEENAHDESFVTCYICKMGIKKESSVPLLNSPYIQDIIINDLPLKKFFEQPLTPRVCESCQSSVASFHNILDLILVHCQTKSQNDSSEIKKCENQDGTEIEEKVLSENFDSNENGITEIFVKVEVKTEIDEEYNSINDFQVKQEEVDVEMDCETEPIKRMEFDEKDPLVEDINTTEIFRCHLCKFQTKYKCNLKIHMLVHKDINETEIFTCHLCNYQTKRKPNLKTHMLTHQKINESATFKCHLCKYKTKQKYQLNRHLLIHKNINEIETFKCHLCQYQAKHRDKLKRHMLIHKNINEIKTFECHLCKFQTKHKCSLKEHMLTHRDIHEIEMFSCHLCKFQTKRKASLKRHLLTHKSIHGDCM